MTLPCEQHGEPQFIAGLDGVLIALATAWMNHSRDAVLRRQTHRVIKVANQTTMLKRETEEIGRLFERTMLSKFGPTQLNEHFLAFNTICDATQERQDAMFSLVDEPLDLMVVIGGYNSSNTTHLQEIAINRGIRSFHIDTPERISADNSIEHKPLGQELIRELEFLPSGTVTVGITSGASTPDRVVEHVIQRLISLSEEN